MSLNNIVDVVISANTSAVQVAGFGTPLFCFQVADKELDDIDFGEGGDGVAQPRTIRTFKITALEDLPESLDSTSSAYKAASAFFRQSPAVAEMVLCKFWKTDTNASPAPDASYGAAVSASIEEDSSWYVITSDATDVEPSGAARDTEVASLAAAVGLGNGKLYFVADDNALNYSVKSGIAVAGDVCGAMLDLNSDRVISMYHQDVYAACAFAGHNLPYTAGSATWAYLGLDGFGASAQEDVGQVPVNLLTQTNIDNLKLRNANFIESVAGAQITREGKASSGEYIDIVRGIDSMDEVMTKSLFTLLINQKGKKIPYTNTGINQVRGVMNDVLNQFVNSGFIEGNFIIDLPDANDVPFLDKASRILQNAKFTAYLQGAIHTIKVAGEVTFS